MAGALSELGNTNNGIDFKDTIERTFKEVKSICLEENQETGPVSGSL